MKKRLGAIATIATVAAAAGLLTSPSHSASTACGKPPPGATGCVVSLTAGGPSPSMVDMPAEGILWFSNPDTVTHKVVFANGSCSLTLAAGELTPCSDYTLANSSFYAGSYAYTVDGKFSGTVVTTPLSRSVSLTARTRMIRDGSRVTLHGQVVRSNSGAAPPPPVVLLARHDGRQPFERVATARTRGPHQATYGWKLAVQPHVTTTYIATVTAQRLCYYPASRCAHPHGQVWVDARSLPLTIRIRH
jgi:hypothetical protein